jgi:penicillin-binding protein 2
VLSAGGQRVAQPPAAALELRPATLAALRGGMCAVVNEQGTAWRARLPGVVVCGKTGSAQVVGHARLVKSGEAAALLPHGWFVGFAPEERPRIALAVLVEHGGSGSEAAAPIARRILDRFFGLEHDAPARRPDLEAARRAVQAAGP